MTAAPGAGGWPLVKRVAAWLFFAAVLALIVQQARTIDWNEVLDALRAIPGPALLAAAALAACSHLLYSTFDLLGRRMTGHRLGTRIVMRVTFISYAFNLNLGALVGGVAFRYRLYSRLGLDNLTITRVLGFSMLTNWLGYVVLAGAVFCFFPTGGWMAKGFGSSARCCWPRARPTCSCARSRASTPGTCAATSWTPRRCAWRCSSSRCRRSTGR
jgi:uncharacterized membrane protein YbhN (UPF0104 family)